MTEGSHEKARWVVTVSALFVLGACGTDPALDSTTDDGVELNTDVSECYTSPGIPGDRHIRSRSFEETIWKTALAPADVLPPPVKDKRGRKRVVTDRKAGLHALRHYCASVMLADGVNIKELAEYLGHHDPGFTLRIYAHLLPDSRERARQAVDARMFRPRLVASAGSETTQSEQR